MQHFKNMTRHTSKCSHLTLRRLLHLEDAPEVVPGVVFYPAHLDDAEQQVLGARVLVVHAPRLILGAVMLAHGINHIIGGGKIAGTGRWFGTPTCPNGSRSGIKAHSHKGPRHP